MLRDSTQDLVCRGDHVTTRQAELGDSEEEFVSYGSRETGPSWTGPVGGAPGRSGAEEGGERDLCCGFCGKDRAHTGWHRQSG